MEYRIIDNNLWENAEGNHELFLQIEITNEGEIWRKAVRISSIDVARVVVDSNAINDVALEMANRAVITRPQEKINDENLRLQRLEEIKLEPTQEEARLEQIELDIIKEEVRLEEIKK